MINRRRVDKSTHGWLAFWRPMAFSVMVVLASAVLAVPSPAVAAVDDGFSVLTTTPSNCGDTGRAAGGAQFVDYGQGAPGGGNNDDYIEVGDFCPNNDGVKAWAWLNGNCLDGCKGRYNGNGSGSPPVVWDPFPSGNVSADDYIGLKVCSVNGPNGTPYHCATRTVQSKDG